MRCACVLIASLALAGCELTGPRTETAGISRVTDSRRDFRKPVENWMSLRTRNVVMQQEDYSCGAAALATVLRLYWGYDVTEAELLDLVDSQLTDEEYADRVENGLSMTDLRLAAVEAGFLASLRRVDLADLAKLKLPVIVRIIKHDYQHFVVFRGMVGDRVFLADPIRGNIRLSVTEFSKQWNGVVLAIIDTRTKPPSDSSLLIDPDIIPQPELQGARQHINRTASSRRALR